MSTQNTRQGLPNIGNSCYLNAFLQMLYDIEDFRNFIYSDTPPNLSTEQKGLKKYIRAPTSSLLMITPIIQRKLIV